MHAALYARCFSKRGTRHVIQVRLMSCCYDGIQASDECTRNFIKPLLKCAYASRRLGTVRVMWYEVETNFCNLCIIMGTISIVVSGVRFKNTQPHNLLIIHVNPLSP